MIITISGSAGSGKNTIGDLLGKKLNLRIITSTMKSYAREKGISMLEFERMYAQNTEEYDKKMDEWQKKEASKGDCILISMLAAYNVPSANLKVWLHCSEKERAQRIAKRDNIPEEKALDYVKERDKVFRERIKRIYGIDFWDPSLYNIIVDTEKNSPEEAVRIILKEVEKCH